MRYDPGRTSQQSAADASAKNVQGYIPFAFACLRAGRGRGGRLQARQGRGAVQAGAATKLRLVAEHLPQAVRPTLRNGRSTKSSDPDTDRLFGDEHQNAGSRTDLQSVINISQ